LNGVKKLTNSDYILAKAKDSNIAELINILVLMPDEANTIYPPYNKQLMARYLKGLIANELVLVLFQDQKIIGTIGGSITRWWWSESKMLINTFFFVKEEHRTYDNAKKLIMGFNQIAKKNLVPVILATSDAKDMERKDMLFEKLGLRKLGSQYGIGV
tara:strand:- start:373 stop:846 length:474 start_codon:yes stop_codon:yes gene_type:complete